MKSIRLLAAGAALLVATAAMADDYNRVSISYNNDHYGYNSDYITANDAKGFSTNGFGVGYTHGFSLSERLPMFIELGGHLNFNFDGETNEYSDFTIKGQFQNFNLAVPVSFAWKFRIGDSFAISPYAGINFRVNMATRYRYAVDNEWEDWVSYLSSSEKNMAGSEYTWNVFQMGWQLGVNFQYRQFLLGVQYGTDFIPAYRHKFEEGGMSLTPAVNTGRLKVSLGYEF